MVVYGMEGADGRKQAYTLLERAVRLHWKMGSLPELARAEEGKPWFPDAPERQFNLSHSGGLTLCALDGQAVGADIQIVKQLRSGLPGRVCAPEELAWLEAGGSFWERFAQLWTLKESRVKQSGRGLRERIAGIRVPLPAPGQTLCGLDGLWFRLYSGPDWRAAVCGLTPPPDGILWL